MSAASNIYTIPAGRPFLDCLAAAILAGDLPREGGARPGPLDLANMTLILPTRRATRAVIDAFLRAGDGAALLLPKVIAISEGDEDAALISRLGHDPSGLHADIPPAMGELERRLTLAGLIMRWSDALRRGAEGSSLAPVVTAGINTPAQATTLAAELAQLMDMVETEDKTLDDLGDLVPDMFSTHWQQTLTFLEIVTNAWPQHLAERGLLSPAGRRNAVIRAEADRMSVSPPAGPVIVAGVSGSVPATVDLMRAVAGLDHGALVLPALDTVLDDQSWVDITGEGDAQRAHPEHPQFGLKRLLDQLDVARSDVRVLGDELRSPSAVFISEAMRPAQTTARWEAFTQSAQDDRSLVPEGLSLIEAPTAQDEAEAIALILREAAETPGKTAALVSPDRLLARRVAVRLEAWGIRVDDSAGRPFRKTPPGAFLDLLIATVAKSFQPTDLMALLKHPLCRLGLDPFSVRKAARALEIIAFRGTYLGHGLAGIEAAIERTRHEMVSGERQHRAVKRLWDEDWDSARDLVERLAEAFAPLVALFEVKGAQPLTAFADAHVAVAEAVGRHHDVDVADDGDVPISPIWQGDAGETGALLFSGLQDATLPQLDIPASDYPDLYRSLVGTENVRPRGAVHPRLSIWGPFEARLQQPDVVVLGSLNDGTWPKSADPGAWLNRPMRDALGLPSPEEKIGQAAHDFATLLHADHVIMTRAEKVDGVPTVPSRWLMRIKALLRGMGADDALAPALPWLAWARARDRVTPLPKITAPAPRPPLELRPRKLSVSRVETWIANPYAIFAREILGLEPLEPLGTEPGASLRGSIVHDVLSRFSEHYPDALPDDAALALIALARDTLDDFVTHPRIAAFWAPRFERFARWFGETEAKRRVGASAIFAEKSGRLQLDLPAGPFHLTARTDRIDVVDNGLVITDYKTGTPPSSERVLSGVAPQLPLEAAIALSDIGFADVPRGLPVTELRYIRASGGEPAGKVDPIKTKDVAGLVESTLEGLQRFAARFDDEATPYQSLRRARFRYDYDDYAHLARVAEWSSGATAGEEG